MGDLYVNFDVLGRFAQDGDQVLEECDDAGADRAAEPDAVPAAGHGG